MAVNCVITWILKGKKATKRSLFFQLNFNNVYTNVDNRERAESESSNPQLPPGPQNGQDNATESQ